MGRVHVRYAADTAHVTLDEPGRRNPVSRAMHHELGAAIDEVAAREDIRFVVLRGRGGVFSSGGDLTELRAGLPVEYVADYWRRMAKTILRIRALDQTVVAAVEGVAVGAGAALALAADVVVAERDVRMRFSFVHLGLLPDAGSGIVLVRALGVPVARDLLMTGRWIGAEEAHARGLVARLADVGEVTGAVEGLLAELRAAPPRTLALAKNLIEGLAQPDLGAAVRLEGVYQLAAAHGGAYLQSITDVLGGLNGSSATSRIGEK